MSTGTILLILLIILICGGFVGRGDGPFYGGPYVGGGLGLVLLIVLILVLSGRF